MVTGNGDLVVKVGDEIAGGTSGQLIIDDVTYSGSRDISEYAGVGNDETQGKSYGNKTFSLSVDTILNGSAATLARQIHDDEILSGYLKTPDDRYNLGELDWNEFEITASDGSDAVQLNADFTVTNVNRA